MLPVAANASLDLNIRRVGLDISQTNVKNGAAYYDSPIQALKADNQEFIKSTNDIALEYRAGDISWDNILFSEYGRTKLKPFEKPETTSENADKILLSSNLSYAYWKTDAIKFGPMAQAQYETEFTANDGDIPRRNIARANVGFAAFDHKIIKDLHLSGVYEYDFTYSADQISKTAAEIGWRMEYEIREGVKLSTDGYYRKYLGYSKFLGTDLERDFSATARLDTNLWGSLTLGPYAQYRIAKSRAAAHQASNFIIGLSFNYITKFGLM